MVKVDVLLLHMVRISGNISLRADPKFSKGRRGSLGLHARYGIMQTTQSVHY